MAFTVEENVPLEGPHALDNAAISGGGLREEAEYEGEVEEERIKPRGRFVLRPLSTTLKDQFLSETLENASHFFSRGLALPRIIAI